MVNLAVVPIFMSAGAAVLPTVLGALASVAAVALKPRELLRLCRQRPGISSITATLLVAGMLAGARWLSPDSASSAKHAKAQMPTHYNWAQVAVDLLAQQQMGRLPTPLGQASITTTAPQPHTPPLKRVTPANPVDFARTGDDGGAAPVQLAPLWSFRPEETMFLAKPVVAGDRIYVAGCQSDLGNYTGLLACLDARTGKPLWQVSQAGEDFFHGFFSSPAITSDGQSLVIGQGLHEDRNCALLCFDTATGRLRWSVQTPLHIESSPAVAGDLAVVGVGAIEGKDGRPTGDPGYVLAVRISDGKELWRQAVNDPECSPAIDENGTVYIGSGFNGNALVALRSETDEQLREKKLDRILWRASVGQPVTGAVTLAGDLVIAGAGNGDMVHSNQDARGLVVAIDKKTGSIRWQTPFDDAVLGAVAFRDGVLICPSRTGEVVALAAENGKVLWRARPSGKAPVLAGTAFTEKRVYAVSSDGYLAALDAKEGKLLEKIYLNDQGKAGTGLTVCPPQVAGGRVIVGSETGGLRCLAGMGSME